MNVTLSLSVSMDRFIEIKKNIVKLGGNKDCIITNMEDITRMAVSGSRFFDRSVKEWGLVTVASHLDQKHSVTELNVWAHQWHNLINDCLKVNDAETCAYLHASIVGGLF